MTTHPWTRKKKELKGSFSAYGGNWIKTTTSTHEGYDSREGSKNTSIRETLVSDGEPGLYQVWEYESDENPLLAFCIRSLASSLLDFDIGGPGQEEVRTFIEDTNPTFFQELYLALRLGVRCGTAFQLKFSSRDKELKQVKTDATANYQMRWVHRKPSEVESKEDAAIDERAVLGEKRWLEITQSSNTSNQIVTTEKKEDGTSVPMVSSKAYYLREYPCMKKTDYYNKDISVLRLLLDDRSPYGEGIGRPTLQAFKDLNQALKDDMAAIKKLLGTPLAAALDLEDLNDGEKTTAQQTFRDSIKGIDYDKTDIITFDKRHQLGYLGMLPGTSPTGEGKIIDIMKHIEPVLSAVLLIFFIPLGIMEQTGANKSLIAQQVLQARKDMIAIRNSFATYLRTQIFPQITDKKVVVHYPPNGMSYELWGTFYANGLVSKEYATDFLGIVDSGTTFAPEEAAKLKPIGGANSNNDDNPSKKRAEPQRSFSSESGV